MNMEKKGIVKGKRGGARPNSGPKPKDKGLLKKIVFLYIVRDDIERAGGEDAIKELCYSAINKKIKPR